MSQFSERVKQYGIPPIPYLPQGKNVLVFRVPNETRTAGGLYIAETAQEPKPCGILVGAGLAARDVMADHLIEIGDEVWFGRFAGWEKEVARDPEGKGKAILQMKIEDVLGSVDAIERFDDHTIARDLDPESETYGEHYYLPKDDKKRRAS